MTNKYQYRKQLLEKLKDIKPRHEYISYKQYYDHPEQGYITTVLMFEVPEGFEYDEAIGIGRTPLSSLKQAQIDSLDIIEGMMYFE